MGLGLHISKCIVEQFEGEVSVISEIGQGSTFTFSFLLSEAIAEKSYVRRLKNPHMEMSQEHQ